MRWDRGKFINLWAKKTQKVGDGVSHLSGFSKCRTHGNMVQAIWGLFLWSNSNGFWRGSLFFKKQDLTVILNYSSVMTKLLPYKNYHVFYEVPTHHLLFTKLLPKLITKSIQLEVWIMFNFSIAYWEFHSSNTNWLSYCSEGSAPPPARLRSYISLPLSELSTYYYNITLDHELLFLTTMLNHQLLPNHQLILPTYQLLPNYQLILTSMNYSQVTHQPGRGCQAFSRPGLARHRSTGGSTFFDGFFDGWNTLKP